MVIADDVDNGTDDVIGPGADRREHHGGVGGDLVNLHVDVSGAYQRTGRVERALPRQEGETPGLTELLARLDNHKPEPKHDPEPRAA